LTVLCLEALKHTTGPFLEQLKDVIPEEPQERFSYKGHDFKAHKEFIEELATRLQVTYPDAGTMDALKVLEPTEMTDFLDFSAYVLE
jgi:hypothetical protein